MEEIDIDIDDISLYDVLKKLGFSIELFSNTTTPVGRIAIGRRKSWKNVTQKTGGVGAINLVMHTRIQLRSA